MSEIAVVGMGQGGMVAAIKLAEQGHSVTVFEKSLRGEVSHNWKDDIRSDVFSICELPMPDKSVYIQKCKWVFVSPDEKGNLLMPPCPPMVEISVYRRGLSEYFAKLAEDAGCKLVFGVEIEKLVIKDEAVCGLIVNGEEENFDLVIDASGMRSRLRAQLPKRFGVQAQPKDDGVLYGYRAFYKRVEGAKTFKDGIDSTVILKHLGGMGISWCNLNEENLMDVLIGRINGLDDAEIDKALAALKKFHPILGDECVFGQRVEVCLRASMARGVADGYVAIGDSAFMTMPLMGSGIESSMKAGKLFADFMAQKPKNYTAAELWKFYANYMRELGSQFALIDIVKRWALALNPKRVDWIFGSGVIRSEDLAFVSTDTDGGGKFKLRAKTVFMFLAHPIFLCSALKTVLRGVRASKVAKKVPEKYDEKRVAKWAEKYDKLIRG